MVQPAAAVKEKEEKTIPISTINAETVKTMFEKGYDAVANGVIAGLNEMASAHQKKIMAEVKKGNWTKAQKLIDSTPPVFKVDVSPDGSKVKVSVSDMEGIKKLLKANRTKFVEEATKIVKSNITSEITKVYASWNFEFEAGPGEGAQISKIMADLFAENFNKTLGVEPPPGVKLGKKIPEEKKVEFVKATVPKDKLPVYAESADGKVSIYWPGWIKEKPKELSEVVPKKI